MIIVGSKAIKYHFPEYERKVNDIDIIGNSNDVNFLINLLCPKEIKYGDGITSLIDIKENDVFDTKSVEVLLSDNSVALKEYSSLTTEYKTEIDGLYYATPEILLSLKKSHIHFPLKFNKHIFDYNFLLKELKEDNLSKITKINFKETEERLGKLKTPSLNKKASNFFGQSEGYVKYFYIHDDIHKVMSHYDRPIYEDMQVDSSSAWCQKDMWEKFTFEKKAKCVLEEAYVIALERKIIPMLNGCGPVITSKSAFEWSIMRICTTLCSGWFRQFATDNYVEIIKYFNPNYVSKFLQAESNGLIKKQI